MTEIGTKVDSNNTLKAIRTNCFTGKETTMELNYFAKFGFNHQWWFYLKNGVTGYESFCLLEMNHPEKGWTACNGTPGSWDRLWVPPDEIIKATKAMKGILGLEQVVNKGDKR